MSPHDWSRLTRPRQAMPADLAEALESQQLVDAYQSRPPYQQNDYIAWLNRAKRSETRAKRLAQILDELQRGDVYMKMKWSQK